MIDHFTLSVRDLAAAKKFFDASLQPLGYTAVRDYSVILGYGDNRPYFWVKQADVATTPQHIAFTAKTRAAVDAFHAAALAAGAKDDGAPGLRADYHPNYYGSFVISPEGGHFLEAVCHLPVVKAAAVAAKKAAPKKAVAKKAAPKKAAAKKKSKR